VTANVLFVCSRNQWRSPTGEKVFAKDPELEVRSAGTSPKARRTVSQKDILWADVIFVMESKHRDRLKASFPRATQYQTIHVLDIPDNYDFMDPDLIEIFETAIPPLLPVSP